MNLVPIDTGGTAPELIGGDASPNGDFAALMTVLMSGDTQIVPVVDTPAGEQLPHGSDTFDVDEGSDIGASILEFVGTPPSGLTISTPPAETSPPSLATMTEEPNLPIEGEPVPAPEHETPHPAVTAGIDSAIEPALATVHPISNHVANPTPDQSQGSVAGAVDAGRSGREPGEVPAVPVGTAPQTPVSPTETRSRTAVSPTENGALPTWTPPADANPVTPAMTGGTLDVSTPPLGIESNGRLDPRTEPTTGEPQMLRSDVELDTGAAARPLEIPRPAGSISQPVMVGVARRVEEAIAALATKPDPKIVTLQLDELDGLRLTVALRPDGLHLSSSGDAALTTEIERALASRGFDMASGRDRQGSEEPADDGWRPQPPNRRRPTDQPGIRL